MLKEEKIKRLEALTEEFKNAKHIIFIEYKGLTVEQTNQLRRKLKEADSEIKVIKNTLAKIAYKKAKLELNDEWFAGPIAIIFCKKDDFTKPINVAYNFSKENELFKMKLGYLDNRIYDQNQLKEIAQLPSYEQMVSRLVGVLNSPVVSLVFTLKSSLTKLVLVLKAIEDKKK